ncbi:MAG: nitrite reductase [Gallionellales bacterium RIFCSPLOWO2_12_FULL_59_22]|nr:MAG: nitrite reductase [Gallionellales bacterium RIFCSPLOWO2_02_FULL_59_110]OGT03836.1 MAG: nitrite reductase [Gallionellales bacterium RIFCSPLOWO2_02_58_13]OGT12152.1 MAG: nitrite reductase [Gallionellales bacterium RIFCSPLOWO2_12_FULL_59_22]
MSEWMRVCPLEEIPKLGSRVVQTGNGDIAVFRNGADAIFALRDQCPHKGGPLSQGIVSDRKVTCPLHGWAVQLDSGEAVAPDCGCTNRYRARVDKGEVYINLSEPK